MANPQPDKFTRISNDLYEAIMQTDFTKRQRNILDFVIRMSYGCQKKYAILKPSDFELVGVGKNAIGSELRYLMHANVLNIDGYVIQINKDYERWRVSMVKNFNKEKFNQVLKRNLSETKEVPKIGTVESDEFLKQELDSSQNRNYAVPKIGTVESDEFLKQELDSSQNRNYAVPKIGTVESDEFLKQELDSSQNRNYAVPKIGTNDTIKTNSDASFSDPKDIIKDNIKTISSGGDTRTREGKLFRAFEDNFLLSASSIQREKLYSYLDDGMDPELILKAITITRENGKDLNYLWGVLNRMLERGIKTIEAHEFYERKRRDERNAAHRNRYQGDHRENRDLEEPSGYYAGIGKRI